MIVVDASVWVSFFLAQDLNHQPSHNWLNQQLINNQPLYGPVLLLAEVCGPVARRTGQPEALKALQFLKLQPLLTLVNLNDTLGIRAARLASTLKLRGADAVYVALSQQLRVPLVTWDKEIINRTQGIIEAVTP